MKQFCPKFSVGGSPPLSVWSLPRKQAPAEKKLVRGVFAASFHTRHDFAPLMYVRIFPQVEPIGKSSISVSLFPETVLSFPGIVCSLGGFVMTKWSCALTRLRADCFSILRKINAMVSCSPSLLHTRIWNMASIWGAWLCNLIRDHCENTVFQENIKFQKNCQKFLFGA